MSEYFASFKKGSKSCRNILAKPVKVKADPCKLTNIITFFQLIGTEIPPRTTVYNFVGIWNLSFIPNKLRDFIFKFYNNKLGLNTRTSHFGGDTRACTFCFLLKRDDTDETFAHLFYDCPVVEQIHSSIDRHLFNFMHETTSDKKARWFGCNLMETKNLFLRLFFLTIQYFIWGAKLGKFIPPSDLS